MLFDIAQGLFDDAVNRLHFWTRQFCGNSVDFQRDLDLNSFLEAFDQLPDRLLKAVVAYREIAQLGDSFAGEIEPLLCGFLGMPEFLFDLFRPGPV